MTDTAADLFKHRLSAHQTTVLIFYRGERSFFCRQWLRRWLTIPALDRRLELADVALLFTSSQSQGKAFSVAHQLAPSHPLLDRRLFFFGDPEHTLVATLAHARLPHPVITNPDSHRAHGWVFDYGMTQPAVVAVAPAAATAQQQQQQQQQQQGSPQTASPVVYAWTSKPSLLNVAGKLDRPDPWDVWDRIERHLDRIRLASMRATATLYHPLPQPPPPPHSRHQPIPPHNLHNNNAQLLQMSPAVARHNSTHSQRNARHSLTLSSHVPDQTASPLLGGDGDVDDDEGTIPVTKRLQSVPASTPHPLHQHHPSVRSSSPPLHHRSMHHSQHAPSQPHHHHHTLQPQQPTQLPAPPPQQHQQQHQQQQSHLHQKQQQQGTVAQNAEVDVPNGPLSTSVDTLVEPCADGTLLHEDLDISHTNLIGNIRVHDLSARINALANDLIAEHALSLATDSAAAAAANPPTVASNPPPQTHVATTARATRCEDGSATTAVGAAGVSNGATGAVGDCHGGGMGLLPLSTTRDVILEKEERHGLHDDGHRHHHHRHDDVDDGDHHDEDDEADPVSSSPPNAAVHGANLDVPPAAIGASSKQTETSPYARSPPPPGTSGPDGDLEPLFSDDVQSESLKPFRRFDLFERHSSVAAEPLETSVPSGGSDQVDSTTVTTKHASMRTDDSSQFNSLHYEHYDSPSFSSDRRIPEEADDRKVGVSDHLRELKDPALLGELHQRDDEDALDVDDATGAGKGKVDRSIHEPQTLIMDASSLEVSNAAALPTMEPQRQKLTAALASNAPLPPDVMKNGVDLSEASSIQRAMPLSSNLIERETSPYREGRSLLKSVPVDVSPFADADNDMEVPEESMTKSSLRDEYEAYDEYIVCEYEVEEHVEEYDSDALSRSRGLLPGRPEDGRSVARSSSAKGALDDTAVNTNAMDGSRRPRSRAELDRRQGDTLSAMASAPTLTPGLEARVLEWGQREQGAVGGGQVRRVLRKIRVPILSGRRRGIGGKGHGGGGVEGGGTHVVKGSVEAEDVEGECGRVRRKDTLRTVLRKRPASARGVAAVVGGGRGEERGAVRMGGEVGEEQVSRVGRKETLKAVWRKIPMPKNRRRASTGEGATIQLGGVMGEEDGEGEDGEGWRNRDRGMMAMKSNSGHTTRTGALQAVLQRLPSLSGTSREQRVKVTAEGVVVGATGGQDLGVGVSGEGSGVEGGKRYGEVVMVGGGGDDGNVMNGGTDSIVAVEAKEGEDANPHATFTPEGVIAMDSTNEVVGGEETSGTPVLQQSASETTHGPESPELREDSMLPARAYDGDVWVAGLEGVGKGRGGSSSHTMSAGGHDGTLERMDTARKLKFGRSMSKLTNAGDGSLTGDEGGDGAGMGRADDESGVAARRRQRRKRRGEGVAGDASGESAGGEIGGDSDGGEKVGGKMSFASVGGRIRSRFKMV